MTSTMLTAIALATFFLDRSSAGSFRGQLSRAFTAASFRGQLSAAGGEPSFWSHFDGLVNQGQGASAG
eukprot:CAMPEP_0117512876 /NCGR_PEP_ID=MMETSP0784-20121206/29259_1 /TAXON_ID=39447 /ORGANISM="" /LENGTH=67 /DNA_ID=CAMNT_0005308613 /DNA_START=72 /DNA_END=278 /DNA_ORIENTATION=+